MLFDTNNIRSSISDALKKAVKSRSAETVDEYVSFYRNLVTSSIREGNFTYYKEFIRFPSLVYSAIGSENKRTGFTDVAMNKVVDMLGLHLREIIFLLNPRFNLLKNNVGAELRNQFYYEAFAGFNDFLYKLSRAHEWQAMKVAIGYFNGLSTGDNDATSLRLELNGLERQNINGAQNDRIAQLKEQLFQYDAFGRLRRHVNVGIKYWLYFLYEQHSIDEDNLLLLIAQLEQFRYNTAEDVIFFRTADLRTYMGWDNWDFEDHEESGFYSPPIPGNWMTKGFVIDSIRLGNLSFKIPLEKVGARYELKLLTDALNEEAEYLARNITQWSRVLHESDPDALLDKVATLRASIAASDRIVNQHHDRDIVAAPLSDEAQAAFKLAVEQSWAEHCDIRKLFDQFSNKMDVSGASRLLKRVGPNSFFERAKIQFIDGPHFSTIHGIEDLGAMVGRWENDLFLEVAFANENIVIQETSYLKAFESCFTRMNKAARTPTIILVHPADFVADRELAASKRFSRNQGRLEDSDNWPRIYFGVFDGAKIFGIHAERLRNRVLVTDFGADFQMLYKTSPEGMDNLLSVKIETVSDELANNKLAQNPDKWMTTENGERLSREEALLLIKTSIVIDIETIVDFEIKDDKYTIGIISNAPVL